MKHSAKTQHDLSINLVVQREQIFPLKRAAGSWPIRGHSAVRCQPQVAHRVVSKGHSRTDLQQASVRILFPRSKRSLKNRYQAVSKGHSRIDLQETGVHILLPRSKTPLGTSKAPWRQRRAMALDEVTMDEKKKKKSWKKKGGQEIDGFFDDDSWNLLTNDDLARDVAVPPLLCYWVRWLFFGLFVKWWVVTEERFFLFGRTTEKSRGCLELRWNGLYSSETKTVITNDT